MKKISYLILVTFVAMIIFAGCGQAAKQENNTATTTTQAQETKQETKSEEKPKTEAPKKVTLRQMTWTVPDSNGAFDEIKKIYEGKNSNVTIEVENVPTDQYTNVLKTKLISGDAPDIIGLHPVEAEYKDAARNGYLEDITNDPLMQNVLPGLLNNSKVNGKIYGVPYDQASMVVLYNKKIFTDNGIKIPNSYPELLEICEKLKSKGITPAVHGIKDWYVVQFFPYQIAPTVVYSKNPNWDADLKEGKVKFNGPEWKKVLEMYLEIEKKGYFTKNALGVGDQQSVQMFGTGKAAMIFQGSWSVSVAKQANPDIQIGAFPFPANQPGEELWMSASVGQLWCVSKNSKNLNEAKKYLAAWTQPEVAQLWATKKSSASTIKGVKNDFNEAMVELGPYYEKLKSWQFCNNDWPAGVEEAFCKKFQELYASPDKVSIEDVLKAMDKKAQESLKK